MKNFRNSEASISISSCSEIIKTAFVYVLKQENYFLKGFILNQRERTQVV